MSTVDSKTGRGTPWLLGALGAAVLAAFLVWLRHGDTDMWLVDFDVYRFGASNFLAGHDLYLELRPFSQMFFTYPPVAAVLFAPTALGPFAVAGLIWVGLDAVFLAGSVWLVLGAVGVRDPRYRAGLAAAVVVLAVFTVPVELELALGQLNALLMFLVLLDLVKGDGKRWQGIGIGIAAGIKLIPLIYVVYLACTGRLRAAATALGAFAGMVLVGFIVVPDDALAYWFGPGLSPNRPGVPQAPFNASLRGVVARLLGTDTPTSPVWLAVAAVVGLIGLAVAVSLHRRGFTVRGVFVCVLTALLVSPVSWLPHWVWAVPLVVVLAAIAWRHRSVWWLALTALTVAVFALRVVFWLVPPAAFYPMSTPANLGMSPLAQLAAALYPILAIVVIVALSRGTSAQAQKENRVVDERTGADRGR